MLTLLSSLWLVQYIIQAYEIMKFIWSSLLALIVPFAFQHLFYSSQRTSLEICWCFPCFSPFPWPLLVLDLHAIFTLLNRNHHWTGKDKKFHIFTFFYWDSSYKGFLCHMPLLNWYLHSWCGKAEDIFPCLILWSFNIVCPSFQTLMAFLLLKRYILIKMNPFMYILTFRLVQCYVLIFYQVEELMIILWSLNWYCSETC